MLKILWHKGESARYTDHINPELFAREGNFYEITHLVIGPRRDKYEARCDITVHGKFLDCDYTPYREFNERNDMLLGVLRVQFEDETRQNITQVFWKNIGEDGFLPVSTTATFVAGEPSDFDARVAQSIKLSREERLQRLANACKKPPCMQTITSTFHRNPDVVAEVLYRANGICESCKKPAPFNRANDGRPYLEVHHRIRLADGGDDTVENAVALCPNCHRKAHYG